jgi:hypothetical protein
MYAVDGDWIGAGLAVVGVVPIIGTTADAARIARVASRYDDGPVIVGESMYRVRAAAATIPGARTLSDMPDFAARGLVNFQVTSEMMKFNRKWLLEQLRTGRKIIDIGPDPNRMVPSIFYEMERTMIRLFERRRNMAAIENQ